MSQGNCASMPLRHYALCHYAMDQSLDELLDESLVVELAQVGEQLAQVGEQLAQVGEQLAQVGEQLAQVGEQLAQVGKQLAQDYKINLTSKPSTRRISLNNYVQCI